MTADPDPATGAARAYSAWSVWLLAAAVLVGLATPSVLGMAGPGPVATATAIPPAPALPVLHQGANRVIPGTEAIAPTNGRNSIPPPELRAETKTATEEKRSSTGVTWPVRALHPQPDVGQSSCRGPPKASDAGRGPLV